TVFATHRSSTSWIHTTSLHDALPISSGCLESPSHIGLLWRPRSDIDSVDRIGNRRNFHRGRPSCRQHCAESGKKREIPRRCDRRSEEHTSELQSPYDLVCRLLLEKKK